MLALGCGASPPAVTESAPVTEDASVAPDTDPDHDGLAGASDACPCDAEDADSWQDEDGCPDLDNDGDRIVDACDLCPNEPEVYQGNCDEDGCPDRSHLCIGEASIQINADVYFARGSAAIGSSSAPLLDAVATALDANPQLTLVAVLGEAERREPHRDVLALQRAQAVIEELVRRGVARERLAAEADLGPASSADAPGAHRHVRFEVRSSSASESFDSCSSSRSSCEVPVCDPTPPPPAC